MESWHEPLTLSDFNIKIYLDTNILCYYLDEEYPTLNKTLDFFRNSEFITLLSSEIVLLELVSVRKRVLYFQRVVDQFPAEFPDKSDERRNLWKDFIKHYKDYSGLPYRDIKLEIKKQVFDEINGLKNLYPKIEFERNTFHNQFYEPCANLILNTNFSRADSLVLISALLPAPEEPEVFIYLLTKDRAMIAEYSQPDLDVIFNEIDLTTPVAERVTSVKVTEKHSLNLTDSVSEHSLYTYLKEKIKILLTQRNENYFLGKTITPHSPQSLPKNCVGFRLLANKELHNNIHLIIVSKDLDFVYNVKVPIEEFHNRTKIEQYPASFDNPPNISFLAFDFEGDNQIPTKPEIITRLRESGHLVFVHPNSLI
jgi:hypothetical protein